MPHLKAAEFRPVARELWGPFAAGFSEQHEGWSSTLAELDTDLLERRPLAAYAASLLIADEEPFQRMELDTTEPSTCLVRLGSRAEIHHCVRDIVGVYLHCTDAGEHRGVRIDAGGNTSLLVEFSTPALPHHVEEVL